MFMFWLVTWDTVYGSFRNAVFDLFVCWMDIKLPIHWYRIHSQNRVPSQGHELLRFLNQINTLQKDLSVVWVLEMHTY